jgi:two-component system OmpR family sensor kinase
VNARGTSLFAQTIALLLLALVLAQLVNIGMFLLRAPPRPEVYSLSDIGDVLAGRRQDGGMRGGGGDLVRVAVTDLRVPDGMTRGTRFLPRLARSIGRPEAVVELWYQADQSASFPFRRRGDADRGVMVRRGEPLFFNSVFAAARTDRGWWVVRTPPRPFLSEWQRWTIMWFGLSTLLLLPLAWLFARATTGPMRRFVEAADRFGRDEAVPQLPVEGPRELRTTAQALNRMQARIDAQIRERTSMIGAIAHDLRTPLARIAFRIESADDVMREKVQADVNQMRAMIADTMAFVRGTNPPIRPDAIDLAALIADIADTAADTGRAVRFSGSPPVTVMGDALALERLLDNLLNNAVAFAGAAEIELAAANNRAIVLVRDRGPGLSEAMLSRAFDPFERGDPSRSRATGGVGLGLTIAQAIARSHGGELTLANRSGGGLDARLSLPLAG